MALRLNYSDGNPLAYIPEQAARLIRERHQSKNPGCQCEICQLQTTQHATDRDRNQSRNHNRNSVPSSASRKRQLHVIDSDDDNEHEQPKAPKPKRRKTTEEERIRQFRQELAQKYASNDECDDEVEAYSRSDLQSLKVKELKELLKSQKFPVSGNKDKLIRRLMYPREAIVEMKRSFYDRLPKGVRVANNTPQSTVNRMMQEHWRFDPNDYVWTNGKIKRRARA
mmetsp:Transcript_125/g.187  ORF Transcript_125/g.187 Transcript_125/m.187 type:complete len:225 (-) Transcript_125:8-682(-)